MGDGGPIVTGPDYVRDSERQCFICKEKGCVPIEHVDKELSDFEAANLAQECIDDGMSTRAKMLGRYVLRIQRQLPQQSPK